MIKYVLENRICKITLNGYNTKVSFMSGERNTDLGLGKKTVMREEINKIRKVLETDIKGSDNKKEVKSIINDINKRLNSVKSVNYCKNKIINAVLNVKLNDERSKDIDTQLVLEDCEELQINDNDLCSLISNLFDNAIESCLRISDPDKAFVEMRSAIRNDYFIFRMTNSCEGGKTGATSKGEGHGYGLKTIGDICKKYGGEFVFEHKDNVAISTVFIKQKSNKEAVDAAIKENRFFSEETRHDDMARIRHDISNQLLVIEYLISTGQSKERAEKMIDALEKEIDRIF